MFFNKKFILASSSSSRYKILKNNNLSFTVIKPKCNEELLKKRLIRDKTEIKKISLELARLKSQSVSLLKKNILVVGSDTVINFNNKLLSKAKNLNEAKIKIFKTSGKTQQIYSSASAYYNNVEIWHSTQKTTIKMRQISKKEINKYLSFSGKEILTSVGSFQLEKMGPNIVENIKGDFFNVMGFPLFPFLKFLKKYKNR